MTLLDSLNQVVGGIIDTRDDVGISFGVGGPQNNYLI
jgi:hypothetical protein